jgi:hypothetical protein
VSDEQRHNDSGQDPPGAVSSQNQEEAESGHRGPETQPERRKGEDSEQRPEQSSGGSAGEAGEGSQSTGHPDNAG